MGAEADAALLEIDVPVLSLDHLIAAGCLHRHHFTKAGRENMEPISRIDSEAFDPKVPVAVTAKKSHWYVLHVCAIKKYIRL